MPSVVWEKKKKETNNSKLMLSAFSVLSIIIIMQFSQHK